MTEEIALTRRDEALPAWMGDSKGVLALADRLGRTHKAVREHNMTQDEVLNMAQHFTVHMANPWRDDIYVYREKGGTIVYVDSYKILTRWAREACKYDDKFEHLEAKAGELHRMRCWIMRDDRKPAMQQYIDMGVPVMEAYKMAASYGDGVVREEETTGYKKPPTGWTWEQRCKIRALKNALRLSHGAPSPEELYRSAMTVNGTMTLKEDWDHDAVEMSGYEAERLAELKAQDRVRSEAWAHLSTEERLEKGRKAGAILHPSEQDLEGFPDKAPLSPAQVRAAYENQAHQAHEEEVKLTHEQVAAGLEQLKATEAAKKPPPATDEQPASQKHARIANDAGDAWREGVAGLIEEIGYYTLKDGGPGWDHLTAAAYIMGYPDITQGNMKDVIEALATYAEDQEAIAAENSAEQPANNGEQAALPM